jgi:hypothetical protein
MFIKTSRIVMKYKGDTENLWWGSVADCQTVVRLLVLYRGERFFTGSRNITCWDKTLSALWLTAIWTPENGGSGLLWNVGKILPDYTTSHSRKRLYSSWMLLYRLPALFTLEEWRILRTRYSDLITRKWMLMKFW